MDSLLNEMKLDFKRGQRIRFTDSRGDTKAGRYVMAGSAEGYVVLNMGGAHGIPKVVAISSILPDYGASTVNALRRMK